MAPSAHQCVSGVGRVLFPVVPRTSEIPTMHRLINLLTKIIETERELRNEGIQKEREPAAPLASSHSIQPPPSRIVIWSTLLGEPQGQSQQDLHQSHRRALKSGIRKKKGYRNSSARGSRLSSAFCEPQHGCHTGPFSLNKTIPHNLLSSSAVQVNLSCCSQGAS